VRRRRRYALVLTLLAIRIRLNIVSRHYLLEKAASADGGRAADGALNNLTKRRFLSTEHLCAPRGPWRLDAPASAHPPRPSRLASSTSPAVALGPPAIGCPLRTLGPLTPASAVRASSG
jgi:hypothetical protein